MRGGALWSDVRVPGERGTLKDSGETLQLGAAQPLAEAPPHIAERVHGSSPCLGFLKEGWFVEGGDLVILSQPLPLVKGFNP